MKKSKSKKGLAKLPVQQLAILAVCRFAEPIASTSVFPYLPEMIESFNVDKINVAKWAGITSATFSISQCLTAVAWGRASDRFGRKPVILIGLSITMCTSMIWGLSSNLPMAIIARALSGGGNGNVGIIRTMVAEMVQDNKELQPRAFSIMPLVWSIGSILGPAFGGFLAQPDKQFPALFGHNALFLKFPFLLPNLVAAIFFAGGIFTGFFFLKETLASKKNKPDIGLKLGKSLVQCVKRKPRRPFRPHSEYQDDEASGSLLRPTSASSHQRTWSTSTKATFDDEWDNEDSRLVLKPPGIKEVFTKQSIINLAAYTFLAMHSVAFDQVLPIFMHTAKQVPDSTNTNLPFKFSGGFGLESGRIGTLFTMYGVVGGFIQFVIFPPVARRFGVLNCFKVCALTFPFIFLIVPYTALVQDSILQQAALFAIMVVKSFAVIFAFPCSTILLTNSALSLRVLGTLNGFATSISAIGRAAGPALTGACFSWGVKHGYMIVPWWMLSVVAVIGAIPVFCLQELDGFNSSREEDEEEEDEDDEGEGSGLLTSDGVSEAVTGDDAVAVQEANESAIDIIDGPPLSTLRSRSDKHLGEELNRPVSRLERRVSSPVGMKGVGPDGQRMLSTALGVTNTGAGTGGTTFH